MKKIALALSIAGLVTCSTTKTESAWNLLIDPTVVTTATVSFVANVLPDHIVNNDSGLIFALCVNYLIIDNKASLFDRIPKFTAAYIAGGFVGRIVKELRKLQAQAQTHVVKPAASDEVAVYVDAWTKN